MVSLWNLKDLPFPPVCTYKNTTFSETDIKKFRELCEDFKNNITKYPHLHSEYLILSRTVYRMKLKFRNSKDFKALEKLNKALRRYFNVNLSSNLQNLIDLIPDNFSDDLYLPTKNMVDYILVRLQGVAKLMEYIIGTCLDVAYLLNIRIYTGHFWKVGFILFSMVSRIYILSTYILKTICEFYVNMLSYSTLLRNTGNEWLPENYVFPENLESWLQIDLKRLNQEIKKLQDSTTVPEIINYFNLIDDSDSDVEVTDEYLLIDDVEDTINSDQDTPKSQFNFQSNSKLLERFSSEDIGEIIEVLSDDNFVIDDISEIGKFDVFHNQGCSHKNSSKNKVKKKKHKLKTQIVNPKKFPILEIKEFPKKKSKVNEKSSMNNNKFKKRDKKKHSKILDNPKRIDV